jgi:hypothetical protein
MRGRWLKAERRGKEPDDSIERAYGWRLARIFHSLTQNLSQGGSVDHRARPFAVARSPRAQSAGVVSALQACVRHLARGSNNTTELVIDAFDTNDF